LTETVWTFDWGGIRGEVAALGGMLGPVWFTLPDGPVVQPFAVAPWADDPPEKLNVLPPILRQLRGEFPCVPFGVSHARTDLPDRWMDGLDLSIPPADEFAHGYSANHKWHLLEQTDTTITIGIDYPEDHVVSRLKRRISLDGDLQIKIDLHIEMRRDAALPIGLHPIFALPVHSGAAHLSIPSLQSVRSFPVPVDEVSQCMPDETADTLTQIRTKDGAMLDVTRLPLALQTEEFLAVSLTDGDVRLSDIQNGYAVSLSWDIDTFPRCLLWLSNRGRTAYPWCSRFCAIGIEPVAAAFDLGVAHSANRHAPFARSGTATQTPLSASEPFTTSYSIAVGNL